MPSSAESIKASGFPRACVSCTLFPGPSRLSQSILLEHLLQVAAGILWPHPEIASTFVSIKISGPEEESLNKLVELLKVSYK